MIKTVQDKLAALQPQNDTAGEDVAAIVELTAEETHLVGGGPEVDNDGSH